MNPEDGKETPKNPPIPGPGLAVGGYTREAEFLKNGNIPEPFKTLVQIAF